MNTSISCPRLQMTISNQPDIIIDGGLLQKVAGRIIGNADENGYFDQEFDMEFMDDIILFKINCRLFYSPFKADEGAITGVLFYDAHAKAFSECGQRLTTDFTTQELKDYILDIQ